MCHDCPKRGLAQEGAANEEPWSLYEAAYRQYKSEVRNGDKLYDRYVTDFINSHTFIATNDADMVNEHYKNVMALKELLESRHDLVKRFFTKEAFAREDFTVMHRLFNTTIVPRYRTPQKQKFLRSQSNFGCHFSDIQIDLITQCVNGVGLFLKDVTCDDMRNFFKASLEKPLIIAPNGNRRLAAFMDALRGERLLVLSWQKTIEENTLLLSSTEPHKPLTARQISHALSMARRHGLPVYSEFTLLAKKLKEMPEKKGNPSK